MIDCDPGVDDAIALMVALGSDRLAVQGIVTVAGNVSLALTQRNARQICTLLGRTDVPIYGGCPRPLVRSPISAADVHGESGLQGATLPEPTVPLQQAHGVAYLINTLLEAPAPLTLATLGPLTNLAVALVQCPEIAEQIAQVVVMGGAIAQGNITPVAEFNLYADPHAAQVVFSASLPLTLMPLDITHQVLTTPERLGQIRTLGTPVATVAADLLSFYGQQDRDRHGLAGAPLHDPCVIAYLLRPDLFQGQAAQVAVELASPLTLGQSVVTPDPHSPITVLTEVDGDGVFELILAHIAAV